MAKSRSIESRKVREKAYKAIQRSTDAVHNGAVWTVTDHKHFVHAVDGLCDEIRALNGVLLRVAGFAHMDLAMQAAEFVEILRSERAELTHLRAQALHRKDHVEQIQLRLFE